MNLIKFKMHLDKLVIWNLIYLILSFINFEMSIFIYHSHNFIKFHFLSF